MQRVRMSDGVELAAYSWGEGERAVLLCHGFLASAALNWAGPGIVAALTAAGLRVLAYDARGHGASDKPEAQACSRARMARDTSEVADAFGLTRYGLAGYSMGGMMGVITAAEDPRIERFALCGCVEQIFSDQAREPTRRDIPMALRASDLSAVENPVALAFRRAADAMGTDKEAAARCFDGFSGPGWEASREAVARIAAPTLIIGGRQDWLMARPERLTETIPDTRLVWIEGDHFSAVLNPALGRELAGWFGERD